MLPTLIGEILATARAGQEPSAEFLARLIAGIGEASPDEVQLGLHALWPFTRHIKRDEWLKVLYFQLANIPSAPRVREDVQQWMHKWGTDRDAQLPGILAAVGSDGPIIAR